MNRCFIRTNVGLRRRLREERHLLCTPDNLSSIPGTHVKVEEERQLHIQSSTFRVRPCLKGTESDRETHTDITHIHCVCTHIHTHFVNPVGKTMFLITVLVYAF